MRWLKVLIYKTGHRPKPGSIWYSEELATHYVCDWIRKEMLAMLDEEFSKAILYGTGGTGYLQEGPQGIIPVSDDYVSLTQEDLFSEGCECWIGEIHTDGLRSECPLHHTWEKDPDAQP